MLIACHPGITDIIVIIISMTAMTIGMITATTALTGIKQKAPSSKGAFCWLTARATPQLAGFVPI